MRTPTVRTRKVSALDAADAYPRRGGLRLRPHRHRDLGIASPQLYVLPGLRDRLGPRRVTPLRQPSGSVADPRFLCWPRSEAPDCCHPVHMVIHEHGDSSDIEAVMAVS